MNPHDGPPNLFIADFSQVCDYAGVLIRRPLRMQYGLCFETRSGATEYSGEAEVFSTDHGK